MAPTRKYKLSEKMYAEGDIYLGDHLTRSWTRDERGGPKQAASPVTSEPGNKIPSTPSVYQIKHSHPPVGRTRSSLREPRGSKRNWANKTAIQNVTPEEFHEWKLSFDSLLKSPVGSKLFRLFLESEIAEENLLFWEACEELKQTKKEKRMQKLIQGIFDDYISVYSPREINIDYKMREDIVEQLNNSNTADPDVFREAQMQIYHLMHRDSYPRFIASAQTVQDSIACRRKDEKTPEVKRKTGSKSRVLCCYGNDPDDPDATGQFVQMDEVEMKVAESPTSPVNGKTAPTVKPTDKNSETPGSNPDPDPSHKDTVHITPQNIQADITPPGVVVGVGAVTRKPSETDSSSKRESGIELISYDDDVTHDKSDDVIAVRKPKPNDSGSKKNSAVEVPVDVIKDPDDSGVIIRHDGADFVATDNSDVTILENKKNESDDTQEQETLLN